MGRKPPHLSEGSTQMTKLPVARRRVYHRVRFAVDHAGRGSAWLGDICVSVRKNRVRRMFCPKRGGKEIVP